MKEREKEKGRRGEEDRDGERQRERGRENADVGGTLTPNMSVKAWGEVSLYERRGKEANSPYTPVLATLQN